MILPPAVLGHEENQDWLADTSLPAAGWVDPDSVKTIPDDEYPGHRVLIGDVVDIPDKVKVELLDTGMYKFGSVEFYQPKDDLGRPQNMTVRRFGLLGGGSIPNVKRLWAIPKAEPMLAAKFAEPVTAKPGDTAFTLAFSERQSMDRTQLLAAIKAAMPGLSQATVDVMTDDQLKEFVANLPKPAPTPVVTMGESTPEEMAAALVAAGQDQAMVAAMKPEDLKAAFDLIKPPVAQMSDDEKKKQAEEVTKMSEAQKAAAKQLADSQAALAELHRFTEQVKRDAKVAQIEPACADLIKAGLTPAFVNEWIKPQLLALDNSHAIHRFSEDGATKSGTAFQAKLASAKNLVRLVKDGKVFVAFGEKLPGGGNTESPEAKKAAAIEKAKEHAATVGEAAWKSGSFGSGAGFVSYFAEQYDKNPANAMKMLV
jgi:hypothetical protein